MPLEYVEGIPVMRPLVDYDNQGFWDGVKRHELVFQRCGDCGTFVHPPRPMCPNCQSLNKQWALSSGKGHIYSWSTVAYPKAAYPGIKVPYAVVLVEMEEGVRVVSNIVDVEPEDIFIGMPVEVVFDDIDEELTLYKFKKSQ